MCYKDELKEKNEEKVNEILVRSGLIESDPVVEYLEYFINSSNSKINYLNTIKNFLNFMLENGKIKNMALSSEDFKSITTANAIAYLNEYKKTHKNSSVKTSIHMLSSFWEYLKNAYDLKNIIKLIPKGKFKATSDKESKTPTDEDVKEMLAHIKKYSNRATKQRNIAIAKTLAYTGLRVNELVGLDIDDLHLDCERPYLSTLRKGKYDREEYENVYIVGSAKKVLEDYLEYRMKETSESKALFLNEKGERLQISGVQRMIKAHSKGKITVHMLRHYCASTLYAKTNDMSIVKDMLGHSINSNVTLNTYIYTTKEKMNILQAL